jgi:hypothetical protein
MEVIADLPDVVPEAIAGLPDVVPEAMTGLPDLTPEISAQIKAQLLNCIFEPWRCHRCC